MTVAKKASEETSLFFNIMVIFQSVNMPLSCHGRFRCERHVHECFRMVVGYENRLDYEMEYAENMHISKVAECRRWWRGSADVVT